MLTGHRAAPAPEVDLPGSVGAAPVEEPATGPPAPVPPLGRTEPVLIPDDVLDEVAQLTPGDELDHADLPLPDFDHQTVPQLRGRLRTLDLPELVQLRDYEQAHGRAAARSSPSSTTASPSSPRTAHRADQLRPPTEQLTGLRSRKRPLSRRETLSSGGARRWPAAGR